MDIAAPETTGAVQGVPTVSLKLTINGTAHEVQIAPWVTLLDLVRERLHLTGTKKGCNQGACGACTMLVDDERIVSCLALAVQYDVPHPSHLLLPRPLHRDAALGRCRL